jgi:hypothetical protein
VGALGKPQAIPCDIVGPDPKPDLDGFSTGWFRVAPSRTESTLVQVRPLDAAEEEPVEMAFGR